MQWFVGLLFTHHLYFCFHLSEGDCVLAPLHVFVPYTWIYLNVREHRHKSNFFFIRSASTVVPTKCQCQSCTLMPPSLSAVYCCCHWRWAERHSFSCSTSTHTHNNVELIPAPQSGIKHLTGRWVFRRLCCFGEYEFDRLRCRRRGSLWPRKQTSCSESEPICRLTDSYSLSVSVRPVSSVQSVGLFPLTLFRLCLRFLLCAAQSSCFCAEQ